jgi:hypothetical protein
MNPREKILAFIDELERVIDKSIEAMDASTARIDELEAALRDIAACPERFDDDKRDTDYGQGILKGLTAAANIARAALTPEREK